MNEHLRDRLLRKLETLPDDRAYQVLDYVEFLEARYAEKPAQTGNPFTRFTEAVEDRLRAGRVSATTIAETVGLMNRAANVLNGALEATKTAANEFVGTATAAASRATSSEPASTPAPSQPSSTQAGAKPNTDPPAPPNTVSL